jgi:hypothetical protein
VELPGIEPAARSAVSCESADFTTRNDAKERNVPADATKGVGGVNITEAVLILHSKSTIR